MSPESYTYPVLGEALRRESQEVFNEFVKEVYRVETNIDLYSDDYIILSLTITSCTNTCLLCLCIISHV